MPTFYSRYKIYLHRPKSIPFGRKKLQTVSNRVKREWDKKPHNTPLEYTESIENNRLYTVRVYPDSFTKVIDNLIGKEATKLAKLLMGDKPQRKRKRIPLKKK